MSENLTQQLPADPLRLILAGLESLGEGMTALEGRMTALEEKVDRRLQETRPIWEQVLVRLDGIEGRMNSLENEMRLGFREVKIGLKILNEDILQVRVGQRDLETRTARLESEPAR